MMFDNADILYKELLASFFSETIEAKKKVETIWDVCPR